MIIFPQALILSAAAAGYPLTHPRIGYQTYGFDLLPAAITVSGETAEGPADAPLRPNTSEYWEADALPATWVADLGSALDLDYVGIAGHSIGSSSAVVEVRTSLDTEFADYMTLPGVASNYATTPDTAANSLTGSIDIRVKLAATDYTPAATEVYVSKQQVSGSQQSYEFLMLTAGTLVFRYSPDGTTGAMRTATASTATSVTNGTRTYLRCLYNTSTGDVIFYKSTDGTSWSQIGTTQTITSGAIFNGTLQLAVGARADGSSPMSGLIYSAEVRNGTTDTVVASFTAEDAVTDADTTITSHATGEVWTINKSGGTPASLLLHTFANQVAPADDAPLMFLDDSRLARYVQITLTGSTVPRIAVIYMGEVLAMERKNVGSFTPLNLSRQTTLQRSLSRTGQFLGQGFRRNGVMGSATFVHLDPTWYRDTFDPFVEHARRYPYFFAWCPEEQPEEVGYVWTDKDIVPVYMGDPQWMQVQWAMNGIGNG